MNFLENNNKNNLSVLNNLKVQNATCIMYIFKCIKVQNVIYKCSKDLIKSINDKLN